MAPVKLSKAAHRRAVLKARKGSAEPPTPAPSDVTLMSDSTMKAEIDTEPSTPLSFDPIINEDNPLFAKYFKDTLAKFEELGRENVAEPEEVKAEVFYDDVADVADEEEEMETEKKLSRKARRKANKLSIAELKALVDPSATSLVAWTDTDSSDPLLLVKIRAGRNHVDIPSHWSLKREYLSSKRGIEKPSFQLSPWLAATGIGEMRDAVLEKQAEQTLKQQSRARVNPSMGKTSMDYSKLYDAFFVHQKKPENLSRFGETYYEGKEYETNLKHLRPGELSEELVAALNMQPGMPPPWLINQQRFGTPPSYPALKIPGLNAPIPPGAAWGFHAGGYGKPPVDENNNPLYGGDIFGGPVQEQYAPSGEPVERTLWGELQSPEEESEEEEESDDEEDEEVDDDDTGMETPAGMQSTVPSEFGGMESSNPFTLRKQRHGTETEESTHPREAYQILSQQPARSNGLFGVDHVYNLKGTSAANQHVPMLGSEDNRKKRKAGDVDISIDPESMNKEEIAKKYETERNEKVNSQWGSRVDQDDLTDMIAKESSKVLEKDSKRRKR